MSAETFLDSNIFVYLVDETDRRKSAVAEATVLGATYTEGGSAVVSFQVVQEVLNVVTRKLATPMTVADAQRFVDYYLYPLWTVMPSMALYRQALELQDRYRYSFYDSLIIAAALEAGCSRILSEDLHDGQEIGGVRIVNPFAS